MANHARTVKNVIVLGATGNVGVEAVRALTAHPTDFTVTAVTRDRTKASFPAEVQIVESDLSILSLRAIFQNQDAVVSCISTFILDQQEDIIDAALESGVMRFIPSEYGLDYTGPDAVNWFPVIRPKIDNLNCLRRFQDRMSWTTLLTGSFFDLKFQNPGTFGFDMANRKATVFDGGDVEFETSTLSRIGEAIASILAPEHLEDTANEVVFVNSFTTTQNEILAAVHSITGKELTRDHDAAFEFGNVLLKHIATTQRIGMRLPIS